MEKIKLDKKSLLYLGIILIIALLIFIGLFFLVKNLTKKPEKSILDTQSVSGNKVNVSEEFIEKLSASSNSQKQPNFSEDFIKKLSVPTQK